MPAQQRIKVLVADLIQKIEEARDQADAEFAPEPSVEDFIPAAKRNAIAALRAKIKAVQADEVDWADTLHWEGNESADFKVSFPVPGLPYLNRANASRQKVEAFDPSPYDKDISLLSMSVDTVISVSVADRWAKYL